MSIFTQRANVHLDLTKCKSIFTFTHHVFENFSSCECKVNLPTVWYFCSLSCDWYWLQHLLSYFCSFFFSLFFFCFFFSFFFLFYIRLLQVSAAGFNCSEYLNQWKVLTLKMSTGDLMILSAVSFLLPCIIQAKSKFKRLRVICGW